ncbi:PDZ domain-containing protein [soil metagenome]
MHQQFLRSFLFATLLFTGLLHSSVCIAQVQKTNMSFTVSMERPTTHYFHIEIVCNNLQRSSQTFKLPSWTPGYYWIMNYAKNLVNFTAKDEKGNTLNWKKTAKNAWQVQNDKATKITIGYDMYAFTQSVADPFLDDEHAYIPPAGLFMYLDGQLQQPATIIVKPYKEWNKISTGLEPIKGLTNTFSADNFDELYDCPILIGNHQVYTFEYKGILHEIAVEHPKSLSMETFTEDLKKIVQHGSTLIGDIPYKHYTYLIMGEGRGGLEHRNSMAVFSNNNVYDPKDKAGYLRWLSFLAHEYFHLYNIKCIRPVALGPFDYDKENLTNMLWVSEGITVYYEYIILNRAGLMTREEALDAIKDNIASYENVPGHLLQSATQSSYDTWIQFFSRGDNANNTTISYYDKGCALGFLLDLNIRNATANKKSLDDVMRTLYREFYQQKKRGFTDEEFRLVCENTAGIKLNEVFEYASTTKEIDYTKYFAWAGLSIDLTPKEKDGAFIGVSFQKREEQMIVSGIESNSPASHAGLSTQDIVIAADGNKVTAENFKNILAAKKPGDTLLVTISRHDKEQNIIIVPIKKVTKNFDIQPVSNMNTLQESIYKTLLQP